MADLLGNAYVWIVGGVIAAGIVYVVYLILKGFREGLK